MSLQVFLANFSKNITWTIIAFCKGNLCVDDLFKLKSIFSVTLNIRVFSIFLEERRHYEYCNPTIYHFLTDF